MIFQIILTYDGIAGKMKTSKKSLELHDSWKTIRGATGMNEFK